MMWQLADLCRSARENMVLIGKGYYPARPLSGPWICRVKAAWEVFRGRADAVRWPANQ